VEEALDSLGRVHLLLCQPLPLDLVVKVLLALSFLGARVLNQLLVRPALLLHLLRLGLLFIVLGLGWLLLGVPHLFLGNFLRLRSLRLLFLLTLVRLEGILGHLY